MERRKESTTGSPLPHQIVETNRIPAPVAIKTPKTADKPRKGLPFFIWVIGIFHFNTHARRYTYYIYRVI